MLIRLQERLKIKGGIVPPLRDQLHGALHIVRLALFGQQRVPRSLRRLVLAHLVDIHGDAPHEVRGTDFVLIIQEYFQPRVYLTLLQWNLCVIRESPRRWRRAGRFEGGLEGLG